MPSVGHAVVGLSSAALLPRPRAGPAVLLAGLGLLPDADGVAFLLGVPYQAPWGHRGASHSLALAAVAGLLVALMAPRLAGRRTRTFMLASAVVASHGLLDALTDGGLGVALLWPFSDERFFAPWRPIPVAPIGAGMLSARGAHVVLVELAMCVPLLGATLLVRRGRPARQGASRL